MNEIDLRKHCDDLQIALTDGQEKDICAHSLDSEIQVLKDILGKNSLNPLELLQYIYIH